MHHSTNLYKPQPLPMLREDEANQNGGIWTFRADKSSGYAMHFDACFNPNHCSCSCPLPPPMNGATPVAARRAHINQAHTPLWIHCGTVESLDQLPESLGVGCLEGRVPFQPTLLLVNILLPFIIHRDDVWRALCLAVIDGGFGSLEQEICGLTVCTSLYVVRLCWCL